MVPTKQEFEAACKSDAQIFAEFLTTPGMTVDEARARQAPHRALIENPDTTISFTPEEYCKYALTQPTNRKLQWNIRHETQQHINPGRRIAQDMRIDSLDFQVQYHFYYDEREKEVKRSSPFTALVNVGDAFRQASGGDPQEERRLVVEFNRRWYDAITDPSSSDKKLLATFYGKQKMENWWTRFKNFLGF